MNDDKYSYFLASYRALDADELAALHRRRDSLADEAISALDVVLSEKGVQIASLPSLPASTPGARGKNVPCGVGGWLFLLVVGLLVLGPLIGPGRSMPASCFPRRGTQTLQRLGIGRATSLLRGLPSRPLRG